MMGFDGRTLITRVKVYGRQSSNDFEHEGMLAPPQILSGLLKFPIDRLDR